MGLRSFFKSAVNLFRTISRPDWKTYWLSIKIVFIGVGVLGAIGYLIRIISSTIQGVQA
ncbi:protein translocase SEC61 complex subunit gamma [Candidatus Bathyarchaeota archaeon]|nr:MAG: protein translocase SEC61 complex subunit gamma [Candidatus Bathyarchaeota archaeon]